MTPQAPETKSEAQERAGNDLLSPLWRSILGWGALVAWAIFLVVSLTANAAFAASYGITKFESVILVCAAIGSDFFKALTPPAFFYFLHRKRWWPVTASAAAFSVAMTFSLFASFGFVSSQRMATFDAANSDIKKREAAERIAKKLATDNAWMPKASRPASVIEAEIAAREGDRLMAQTNGCSKTTSSQETWCREYRQLKVDLATAKATVEVETKIAAKQEEADSGSRTEADYQASSLGKRLNVDAVTIIFALSVLTVVLIEICSAFGLTIGLALLSGGIGSIGTASIGVPALGRSLRSSSGKTPSAIAIPSRVEPLQTVKVQASGAAEVPPVEDVSAPAPAPGMTNGSVVPAAVLAGKIAPQVSAFSTGANLSIVKSTNA